MGERRAPTIATVKMFETVMKNWGIPVCLRGGATEERKVSCV